MKFLNKLTSSDAQYTVDESDQKLPAARKAVEAIYQKTQKDQSHSWLQDRDQRGAARKVVDDYKVVIANRRAAIEKQTKEKKRIPEDQKLHIDWDKKAEDILTSVEYVRKLQAIAKQKELNAHRTKARTW